jgi:hypothetical protein
MQMRYPKSKAVRLLAFCALLAGACSTPVERVDLGSNRRTDQLVEKSYTIGAPQSAVVGGKVISVKDYGINKVDVAVMKPDQAFTMIGPNGEAVVVRADEELPVVARRDVRHITHTVLSKGDYGLQVRPDGVLHNYILNNISFEPVEIIYPFTITPAVVTFKPGVRVIEGVNRSSFKQLYEIMFTGIDGQAMRFQYREYNALDFARPMSTQDLTYPMSSKTIRFRDISIQVNAVSAEKIDFTVVSDTPAPGEASAVPPPIAVAPAPLVLPAPRPVPRPASPGYVYIPPPVVSSGGTMTPRN